MTPKKPHLLARPFDPHKRAASSTMREVLKEAMQLLGGYELFFELRKRKRSESAQATFELTVEAILCDLIYRELQEPRGRVHLSQSNQVLRKASRYKGKAMGKTLPGILKMLAAPELNYIKLIPGKANYVESEDGWSYAGGGKQTVIAAGRRLLSRIDEHCLAFTDFQRSDDEEIILLRGTKPQSNKPGPLIEYAETEETTRLRDQLKEINDWLSLADIESQWGDHTHDRRLRRIFNNSDFGQGGRLYGGFWQTMSHYDRLNSLLIDDDSIVELDFGQTGLLLLYSLERVQPPSGDLYDLSEFGIPTTCRPGIKRVIQAAINASKPLDRLPQGTRRSIPKRFTLSKIMDAVKAKHPLIAHRFNEAAGMKIMRIESGILVNVLLALKAGNITALPVHDAVLVNANFEEAARTVMQKVFFDATGLHVEVTASYA